MSKPKTEKVKLQEQKAIEKRIAEEPKLQPMKAKIVEINGMHHAQEGEIKQLEKMVAEFHEGPEKKEAKLVDPEKKAQLIEQEQKVQESVDKMNAALENLKKIAQNLGKEATEVAEDIAEQHEDAKERIEAVSAQVEGIVEGEPVEVPPAPPAPPIGKAVPTRLPTTPDQPTAQSEGVPAVKKIVEKKRTAEKEEQQKEIEKILAKRRAAVVGEDEDEDE